MPGFVFGLQPVLEQREREEQACQRRVAELERARVELEEEIRGCQRRIEQERADLREHLAAASHAPVDLASARLQANASLHHVARAQQAVVKLAGVHRQLDKARLELLEAATRRKAVELLRDKRRDAWEREQDRREAAAMDEMAVIAHHRARDGGEEAA